MNLRAVPARVWALAALLAVTLAACALALLKGWVRPDTLQQLVARAGALGMASYVAGIVVMELLWIPRMWGLLGGGILFGPVLGGALSIVGDLTGAALCYFIARGAGQAWVKGLLERAPRARRVVDLLAARRGLSTVAVLRVCPAAHYTLVSYSAGLTGVRPLPFLAGTAIGILPGAVVYPIAGNAALRPTSPMFLGSVAVMVVFLVVTLIAARRVLKKG
jgi:uncharacterized membrane protein YdjX (TVP38/TMEM64 family)